jgi:plastocyanin
MSAAHSESPLTGEVRFRVPLPIVIPLTAIVVIGGIAFGISRILLSVPKEIAVVIALAVAANILIACTVLALRPQEARSSWAELLVVATYPLVIGVVIAQLGIGEGTSAAESHEAEEAAPAAGTGLTLEAENVAFSTDQIELPAGEETELEFTNSDSSATSHNFSIYEDDSAKKNLFKGDVVPGGSSSTYTIPALDKGSYYFQCDIHPGMNGTVKVE